MAKDSETKTVRVCVCQLCGHRWVARKEGMPLTCPRCKRYDWQGKPKSQ